jgi:hypothetical protein
MIDIERQVADEYAAECFPGTFEDVQARVARRTRTKWAMVASAAATAAAVAVGFAVVRPSHDHRPVVTATPSTSASKKLSAAEFEAACAQQWEHFNDDPKLQGQLAELPPLRFDEQQGNQRLRIYSNGVVEMECTLNATGQVGGGMGHSEPIEEGLLRPIGRNFPVVGSFDPGGIGFYLGGVIPGATAITAHMPGKADVPAKINGDLFLLWTTDDSLGDHIVITARSQQATLVDAIILDRQRADERTATIDASCRSMIDDLVHNTGSILAAVASEPTTLAIKGGTGDHRTWIYRKGSLLVPCDLGERSDRLGPALLPDAPDRWKTAGHVEVMTSGLNNKWGQVFGVAPAGLTSLVLHLPDGQSVPAVISGGMFLAVWKTTGWQVQPEYVAATVKGVHYRIASDGTVQ